VPNVPQASKSLWAHPMVLLCNVCHVEARFGPFEVLSRRKIGARFTPNVQRAWKSFWAHPMGLLGDMCRVEGRFGPFGDSVSLGARSVYDLRRMYQRHGNLFRHTRWYS
jgi:hypothetical protein